MSFLPVNSLSGNTLRHLKTSLDPAGHNYSVGTEIDSIRAEYNRINKLRFKIKEFKYMDLDCVDEGQTTYYLEKGSVRKIVEKFIKDDAYTLTEFYFKEGKLIFALEILTSGPAIGPDTKTEYRYYVKDDQVICQMQDRKVVEADSKFTDVYNKAYKLLKIRNRKDFNVAFCDEMVEPK